MTENQERWEIEVPNSDFIEIRVMAALLGVMERVTPLGDRQKVRIARWFHGMFEENGQ